jgi:putative phosphoribosyl transferase
MQTHRRRMKNAQRPGEICEKHERTQARNASMSFYDRSEAGRRLAAELARYKGEDVVVLALPRGGVPVAAPIAVALEAPLDLILIRKLGVPFYSELAMGAVADAGIPLIVRNEDVITEAGVKQADFDAVCQRELEEIGRRRRVYFGERSRSDVRGRVAIVVDDGVATGATTRAALRAVRALHPKKLVLAVPVAPTDTLRSLRHEADETVCLETHRVFVAIGCYYADFHQIDDEEVISTLNRLGGDRSP